MIPLAEIVEWKPLLEALWTSAAFGLAVLVVAGVGVRASMRAQDERADGHEGALVGYGAVTLGCVVLLAAAIAFGVWAMTQ